MRGQSNKRSVWLLGGLAAFIVVVLYFAFIYPWPKEEEQLSGTIGKVKKYRSEQISEKDLALGEKMSSLSDSNKAKIWDMLSDEDKAAVFNQLAMFDKAAVLNKLSMPDKATIWNKLALAQKEAIIKNR